jgi:hypothetical protein
MHLNMWWLGVISGCFYELNIIVFNFNKIFPYKKSEIYWRSLHLQNSDILVANSHFSYFWTPKFVLCRSHHVCLSNPLSYVARWLRDDADVTRWGSHVSITSLLSIFPLFLVFPKTPSSKLISFNIIIAYLALPNRWITFNEVDTRFFLS